jgi:hypothetical protein
MINYKEKIIKENVDPVLRLLDIRDYTDLIEMVRTMSSSRLELQRKIAEKSNDIDDLKNKLIELPKKNKRIQELESDINQQKDQIVFIIIL